MASYFTMLGNASVRIIAGNPGCVDSGNIQMLVSGTRYVYFAAVPFDTKWLFWFYLPDAGYAAPGFVSLAIGPPGGEINLYSTTLTGIPFLQVPMQCYIPAGSRISGVTDNAAHNMTSHYSCLTLVG